MTQSYVIRIGAADTGDADYITSIRDYNSISINKNPTAFGDWEAKIPYDTSIEDEVLERVFIVDETTDDTEDAVIFAGLLERINSDGTNAGTTTISGRGIFLEEDYDARTITVENSFLKDEIQSFASNHIGFDTTFQTATTTGDEPFESDGSALLDDVNTVSNTPLQEDTDKLYVAEVGKTFDFTQNDFDNATKSGSVTKIDDDAYSKRSGVKFGDGSGTHTFEFDIGVFEYDVPDYELPFRLEANGTLDEARIFVNGTKIVTGTVFSGSHEWVNPLSSGDWTTNNSPSTISSGSSVTVRIEVDTSDSTSELYADCFSLHDNRYSYTLPTSTNTNDVYIGPERVPQNFTYDFVEKGSKVDTKASAFVEIEGYPSGDWKFNSLTAEFTGDLQSGGTDTVSETYAPGNPFDFATYDVVFSSEATGVSLDIPVSISDSDNEASEVSGGFSLPAIDYIAIIPFDSRNLTYIQQKEYSGTDADIFKKLHDDSVYDFSVDYADYDNIEIHTFPKGDESAFEGVTTVDYNRELDYGDYANKVTVVGSDSAGNRITATKQDDDAISNLNGKVVHRSFSMPDKSTQVEVDYAAKNKLRESLQNATQSGSVEAVPSRIQPGKAYGWTAFNDKFTHGGTIGAGGIILEQESDYLQTSTIANSENPNEIVFEFLIWPKLKSLDDNQYKTIIGTPHGNDGDFVRVYGDGSIEACQPTDTGGTPFSRTSPELLHEEVSRVTIRMNEVSGEGGIYIDGGTAGSPDAVLNHTAEPDLGHFVIGASSPTNVNSVTNPDIWYRLDAYDTFASTDAYQDGDNIDNGEIVVDIKGTLNATVDNSDDYVTFDGTGVSGGGFDMTFTSAFEADDTADWDVDNEDFSAAMWVNDIDVDSQLFQKLDGAGHELYIDSNGFVNYRVTDNSTEQIVTGSTDVTTGAHHVGVTLNNDGNIRVYVDGEIDAEESYDYSGTFISNNANIFFGNDEAGNRTIDGTLSEVAWWTSTALSFTEMQELGTFDKTADTFVGGIDDVRLWESGDLQTSLDYPFTSTDNSVYDGVRNELHVLLAFDEASYVPQFDFLDSGGSFSPATNIFNNGGTLYKPERGTLEEVSISLGRGDASMSLKLNLTRRVDAKLNETTKEVENLKNEV